MEKQLALKDIRTDGGTQQRDVDDDVVARYKALMQDGKKFPPISVVHDGKDYWLWDGFHRYHAERKNGKNYIQANITEGTKREAMFFSFAANEKHGFPRQSGTVKAMLLDKIFPDKEWGKMSDEELANWIGGITKGHVSRCRRDYEKSLEKTAPKPKKKGKKSTTEKVVVKDSVGKEVPEHLHEIFNRRPEIQEHVRTINELVHTIKEARAANDLLYKNCKLESLLEDVGNLRRNLRFAIPYAVCPYCQADVNNADCRACDGDGFVNERIYKSSPEEMK